MIFKRQKFLEHLCLEKKIWLSVDLRISLGIEQSQLSHDLESIVTNPAMFLNYLLSKRKDTVILLSESTLVFKSKLQSL